MPVHICMCKVTYRPTDYLPSLIDGLQCKSSKLSDYAVHTIELVIPLWPLSSRFVCMTIHKSHVFHVIKSLKWCYDCLIVVGKIMGDVLFSSLIIEKVATRLPTLSVSLE